MRILQVIPYFAPRWGGDVSVCYSISKCLTTRGHRVTIVTTDIGFDRAYSRSIEDYGVRVLSFPCASTLGFYLISPRMKDWLEENMSDYDIVHLHSARSYQNNIAVRYARKSQVPYIVQAHGSLGKNSQKRILKGLYDLAYGSKIMKHAAKFLAVSELESGQYRRLTKDGTRTELVPNCLDLERFKTLPERGQFREKHGLGNAEIVMYLGRIHKTKDIDLLIRAFDMVSKERVNALLVIAGPDYGHEKRLRILVRRLGLDRHVKFVGFLENVTEAYVDADVLVNPRIAEIFGLVPLEAAMCATPIVVSNRCGIAPLVSESGCGHIVDPTDSESLAKAIIDVLKNKDINIDNAARAKVYLQRSIGCEAVLDRLENVYRECVRKA